jgi:non-lysosomal glucosylceramidase
VALTDDVWPVPRLASRADGVNRWPVIRPYDERHLERISLPVGGIGTGTIGLGGRGDLRDFELGNRPAKGFRPGTAFFAARVARPGSAAIGRVLEGPLGASDFEGPTGSRAANHGLPRFATATFAAAYPFGQVHLADPELPPVTVRAFNPLVPGDLEASSWPLVALSVDVVNTLGEEIEVSIAGVLENFVGANGTEAAVGANANTLAATDELIGISMTAPGLNPRAEANGAVVLSAVRSAGVVTTTRTGWADASWGNSLLDFWDDFIDDGRLDERESTASRPIGSIASAVTLAPEENHTFTFLITWSFPNRVAWRSEDHQLDQGEYTTAIVGNHYCQVHPDPWQTAIDALRRLPALERDTVSAVAAIAGSTVPESVKEAALFNISTMRSPTLFRTADGRFYGWEGVMDRVGSCFGTCTHVWGYEFATSFWFSELAWSFRETQYELATHESGLMSFRVGLPVEDSRMWGLAAADGQMSTLVHLYHDWRLSGDDARLAELWPGARKSLEFAWIPGGWDADQDGVMEGCQHNTMDVEYYGPNPQMGSLYLAALLASAEMADAVGDTDFGQRCRSLFASGSRCLDDSLFTGEYYRHEIRPIGEDRFIAAGLRHPSIGSRSLSEPDLQLGDGVLVDQLVGQYVARLTGLGGVLPADHVAITLDTIFRRNFRTSLAGHFNHMRSFALADESALLMCTYEEGKRPARPFPYFNEIMTGFEYTAAVGMIQDGDRAQGVTVIDAIRARYNGARRNPFDEAECGRHYARAMASWSAFVAWNGFEYDGRSGTISFALPGAAGKTFWSTGSAWGTWTQAGTGAEASGVLAICGGEVDVSSVVLNGTRYELAGDPARRRGDEIAVDTTRAAFSA